MKYSGKNHSTPLVSSRFLQVIGSSLGLLSVVTVIIHIFPRKSCEDTAKEYNYLNNITAENRQIEADRRIYESINGRDAVSRATPYVDPAELEAKRKQYINTCDVKPVRNSTY